MLNTRLSNLVVFTLCWQFYYTILNCLRGYLDLTEKQIHNLVSVTHGSLSIFFVSILILMNPHYTLFDHNLLHLFLYVSESYYLFDCKNYFPVTNVTTTFIGHHLLTVFFEEHLLLVLPTEIDHKGLLYAFWVAEVSNIPYWRSYHLKTGKNGRDLGVRKRLVNLYFLEAVSYAIFRGYFLMSLALYYSTLWVLRIPALILWGMSIYWATLFGKSWLKERKEVKGLSKKVC